MNSFTAAARKHGRIFSLLLLSLLVLTRLETTPAHADGVSTTIGNGQIMSGNISANTKEDDYYFTVPSNVGILVAIGETGAHDSHYEPQIYLYRPNGTYAYSAAAAYYDWIRGYSNSYAGTWKLVVTRADSYMTGGTYEVQLYSWPGEAALSGGGAGGMMYPLVSYAGSNFRGGMGFYNYTAVPSSNWTMTVTATGGTGFIPLIQSYRPDGASGGATSTSTSASITQSGIAGTYSLLVVKDDANDITGTYTVKLSGTGAAMSQLGKQDGGRCIPCEEAAKAEVAGVETPPQSGDITSTGQTNGGTDPINIATGNLYESVTDYTTVGTNPLAFIRSYNSLSYTRNGYPTLMGPNWRTNYDRYLRVVSSTQLAAERPDGQIVNFALASGVGTPDSDVDIKLTYSGSTYTLTDSDDTVETYSVTSGKGTLTSIAYPNGYTQTMNYTSGVLTSVSDSYSRSLSFTYTSGMLTGVTTPDSATLTYGYTTVASQSLLTSVTYNTSPSTSQTYVYGNSVLPFMLTSITDENGNTNSQWTYDGAGRCTMAEHAGGADKYQVSYDDSTGNRTVTGPLGNAETYKFTTLQGVPKVSEIDRAANSPVAAATRTFTYDTNGYLATATDWNGNSTHWTNNSHGLPTSITEAYGNALARTTSITYDSTWVHKPYTTTKTNVTIDDRYNATTGTLTTHTLTDTTGGSTNGHTEVWAYTYNGTGEMLTETFPRTGTTVKNTYTYSSGALASITDQLSHTITISTANGTGQPTKILDANSVETDFVYDNRNRLTSKTVKATPSNEVTTTSYIGSGQPHVVTLPDSSTITYAYDNAQRLTTVTNTAGETINYTLNAAGKPTTTTIKDSGGTTRKSWTATYDVLGDMLTRVGAGGAGQTTTYTYDGNQNRVSVEDANSKTTSLAWDVLNRPSTVTDPLTHTAAPTYNNLDYVTAQTDFLGYSTSYTRDAFGNSISRVSPDTGTWSYTFDADNNPTAVTDARSVASSMTYDAADRLTAFSATGYSGEAIAFTYDDTTSGNKGIDHLTSWTDESGSGSRVFDNFGNVTTDKSTINSKNYTTTYSYDLANRITEIIYPSGRYVDYTYDSSGYLTTVTTKPSSGGSVTTLASSITHKPFGPIASFTYGNSEAFTQTFDNNYWLSTLNTVYSGTYVQELSFTEDNAGNLTAITDTLDSTRNESFGVDDLNRLHTASGKYGSRTYTYDNNSNRATRVAGATTYTTTMVASKNRVDHITDGTNTRNFTWTANGNMATDDRTFVGGGSASFTYGGRDRLESMSVNSQTITYKVNAFGQRVSMAFSGNTTHYIYDILGNLIAEADGSTGTTTKEYVWMEGELLAQIDGSGNIVYVHNSQVGAPQKITNPSRTLVFDQIIEPFGEVYSTPTNTTPTNWRFPGQYYDAENLLNHNRFRDYDPSIAMYIESDPIGFRGGYNLYRYAFSNPAQWIDPLGLDSTGTADMATCASVGGPWCQTETRDQQISDCKNFYSLVCPALWVDPPAAIICGSAVSLVCHSGIPSTSLPVPPEPTKPPCDQDATKNDSKGAADSTPTTTTAPASGPAPVTPPTPPSGAGSSGN